RLRGGEFQFNVGTAGSITLVLQALLPAMIHSRERGRVRVIGGTDIRAAPPFEYFQHVLLPLLRRMGARVQSELRRRGYYPRGGGEAWVTVDPGTLRAIQLDCAGKPQSFSGRAHVANLPAHVVERMRKAATEPLRKFGIPETAITAEVLGKDQAYGQGGAIVLWAETECSVLGAGRVAQRGVRAELLGTEAGTELATDLSAGVSLDIHASDQLLVYLALAGGGSHITARTLSSHAETTIWLIEQFLPIRFETAVGATVSIATQSK
ncbi:MAG TPA: RNA 3'-terminal phosphate cyclase, partial [Burkholderiales bacterium]|nr:RNA 3'-terminal phosphate cyclase [Burkholderiales bacterium]